MLRALGATIPGKSTQGNVVAFRPLSIRDQWVQELLWKHLEPTDIHPEYTKLDAICFIGNQIQEGNQFLWGDETALLRCEGNKHTGVVTPHVLGDGKKFRALLTEGCVYAKEHGWRQVYIWTSRGSIQRMAMRMGFQNTGFLPGYHPTPLGAEDIAILRKAL